MKPLKVILFQGVQNLPNMAAEAQGFFAKRGLALETIFTKGSDQMREGLARGDYDLAHGAVDNAVAMVEVAKEDVFIFWVSIRASTSSSSARRSQATRTCAARPSASMRPTRPSR